MYGMLNEETGKKSSFSLVTYLLSLRRFRTAIKEPRLGGGTSNHLDIGLFRLGGALFGLNTYIGPGIVG